MCIAIIIRNLNNRFPLIVFHSREEDLDRPTSSLEIHDSVLSAVDVKANGVAAVGINTKSGRFAVLTNCRYKPGLNPTGASRGELLKKILIHSSDNLDIQYQGMFHLYYGNMLNDLVYLTNVNKRFERKILPTSAQQLDVIVKSNEHPETASFFEPKVSAIKNNLMETFSKNRNIDSVEEIASLIDSALNSLHLPIPLSLTEASFSWSQLSKENEAFVLSHIFIPPLAIGDAFFGTVSQSLIVSDATTQNAHFWYKCRPDWLWDKRQISLIS